ncbi:kinase-like protein [Violaceomyces palustris]|uniref:Kinase-like protein n=1 Tax=Violaceomyces palustris TaxID=1673888 RepID=A0ACD0P1Y0_9BASI|nr:kinase-like protein [Violaceomyces palustris]
MNDSGAVTDQLQDSRLSSPSALSSHLALAPSSSSGRPRSESRPVVAKIETESLGLGRPSTLSKNSLFFASQAFTPSPVLSGHSREKSSSSNQGLLPSSSASSLDSAAGLSAVNLDGLPTENGHDRFFSNSRWSGGFGSSLQTPACDLSSASSIRSRRNWDEFEGKPVSPLPSPAVRDDGSTSFLFDPPSQRSSGGDDELNEAASGGGRQNHAAIDTPSKTSAFFGASWSAPPRPPSIRSHQRVTSNSEQSDAKESLSWSTLSAGGSRTVSVDVSQRIRQPTRLPTMPIQGEPVSGTSWTNSRATPSTITDVTPTFPAHARLSSTETTNSGYLSSPAHSLDPETSSSFSKFGSSSQASISGMSDFFGSQGDALRMHMPSQDSLRNGWSNGQRPILREETAHGLPASSSFNSSSARPTRGLWDDEAAGSLGSPIAPVVVPPPSKPVPPRTQSPRKASSGHVHGPSENATGSSLIPPARGSLIRMGSNLGLGVETPQEEEEEDEEGRMVGAYAVERTLGVGAFSRVALARRTRKSAIPVSSAGGGLRRPTSIYDMFTESKRATKAEEDELVALKMLDREPCKQNERMKVSWVREVEVLKHISHPNLVRFIASFSTRVHHVLVLERVAGGELFDLLASHHAELARREWLVRRLFAELASAVGWMHRINLVHRDIKLENILLTSNLFGSLTEPLTPSRLPPEPLLKLTDFGLSRFIDPDGPLLETRCGSEEYAAPELIIGKKYDGRKTDSWALGVVLYSLLTGSLPFLEDIGAGGFGEAREGSSGERDAKQRKTHLLRIAKGDLRWPSLMNELSEDVPDAERCPPGNRLITPSAKHIVGRLMRRDATKRAGAWESWDEAWLTTGSFESGEKSAEGELVKIPDDPRGEIGYRWLMEKASVRSDSVSDLARGD